MEAWFTAKFGDAHADPMQAFRTPPTAGVVHRATAPTAVGHQGAEILQRHGALLEGRWRRPGDFGPPSAAGPAARGPASYAPRPPPQERLLSREAFGEADWRSPWPRWLF